MRPLGLLLVLVAVLVPLYWFSGLAKEWDVLPVISQYLGVVALIAMGLIQLLATRLSFLEWIFGGLDRIYLLHKWLGISALAAVFLHDTIDPEIDGTIGGRFQDLGETLGGNSFDMLQILVVITLITLIPYHWWRWTHKLMGVLYILAVAHFAMIDKPFANTDSLALYTFAFCGIGILSYLYTLLPLGFLNRSHRYRVVNTESTGDALAVTLAPVKKGLRHQAGQFAFVQFEQAGLKEVHPFTISCAPDHSRCLRFTIKNLGDFTGKLNQQLKSDIHVRVSGPYGHFRLRHGKQGGVWIAGGIGITPFLAWAQVLKENDKPVDLFYCVRSREQAPHIEELEALVAEKPNLKLHIIESRVSGRLTTESVISQAGDRWPQVRVAYCGPKALREALFDGLKSQGLPARNLAYEAFEIRSGIGLDKIILWLWPKLLTAFNKYLKREPSA